MYIVQYIQSTDTSTDICTTSASYMLHLGAEIRLHMIETCLVQYYFLVASCFGFDT